MKRRLVFTAVWALGLVAGWVVLQMTASRPVPFVPGDWGLVGHVSHLSRVAVAKPLGNDSRGWPLFSGPVEVWDVATGRQVASIPVVPDGWRFNAWNAGRWLRVLPVGPDGKDGPPILFDLSDGREVCRAPVPVYWSIPQESGGRVTVLALDNPTGVYTVTAYDQVTGAAVWASGEYPRLVADRHVVSCPFDLNQPGSPAGPWTVRRSADGAVFGVVPGPELPIATNGRLLLTADGQVWDVATAARRYRLTGLGSSHRPHTPWFSPDGRLLVLLRNTPAGPAVCYHDTATGEEQVGRRIELPADGDPYLTARPDGRAEVRLLNQSAVHWTDRLRGWLPFLPSAPVRDRATARRYDLPAGRRLADRVAGTLVERPDGRPLLTGDADGRPERVWADRPDWLPIALAAGWTVALPAAARVRRRAVVR